MPNINYKKYLIVLLITIFIFGTSFVISNELNDQRVKSIKSTEDKISIGILSLETQFELLQESTCSSLDRSALSSELGILSDKLSYAETQNDIPAEEINDLKKYYSLLEIKDYLLMKKVSQKCAITPITIIYFYSNKNCNDCRKQGFVLTKLRESYPQLRVYTFDYDLDLPAIKTLININNIANDLPAVIINNKVYNGFQELEAIEEIIKPFLPKEESQATTTTNDSGEKKKSI
jgi:hypothetical protein